MINELYTYLTANENENAPTGTVTVGKGWEIEPIENLRELVPALYISPGDDVAEDSGHDFVQGNYITQSLTVDIICLIDSFETYRAAVRSALIGWSESAVHDDLSLDGGRTMSQKGNMIWWQDNYQNQYQKVNT